MTTSTQEVFELSELMLTAPRLFWYLLLFPKNNYEEFHISGGVGEIERSGKYSKYFCANRLQARVRHVGISVISCSYTQSPLWLTVKDYFPFYLYPFTAYFYMQRSDSKDHHIQLKLGENWNKKQLQKHWVSHLWWHIIISYSHFGRLKSLKKLFLKNCFVNGSLES